MTFFFIKLEQWTLQIISGWSLCRYDVVTLTTKHVFGQDRYDYNVN